MRIALYQPDIPQNTGTIIRLAACFGIPLDIVEPCGFILDDRLLKRSSMDYMSQVSLTRHHSWERFKKSEYLVSNRIILLTTKASICYTDITYNKNDILLMGRESAGVPDHVHSQVDERVLIPMNPNCRSLNIAISLSIVLGEALRQTNHYNQLK